MGSDGYEQMAEFHDLFMGETWSKLRTLLERELGQLGPDDLVVDLGAGTGLGTLALVEQTDAEVWAVEPSMTMRAVLLHRVASSPAASSRVSVWAGSVPDALRDVPAPVAGVIATHMLGHLGPDERDELFAWLASALGTDGIALFTFQSAETEDGPADDGGEHEEEVGVGRHRYRATHLPSGQGYRTRYDVIDIGGTVIRSLPVSGTWSTVSYDDIADAAAEHGLACRQATDGVAVVTHLADAA